MVWIHVAKHSTAHSTARSRRGADQREQGGPWKDRESRVTVPPAVTKNLSAFESAGLGSARCDDCTLLVMSKMSVARVLAAARPARLRAFGLRYAHRDPGRGQGETKRNSRVSEEASLPLLQRCKNLLAANWRCQMSSVKPDEEDVFGSLAHYALVSGQLLVWLPHESPHVANLIMDNRGSLVVGHTDPRPLVLTFKEMGYVPPRVAVLGAFEPIPSTETDYIRKRLGKLASSTRQAVENAGPRTKSILQGASKSLDAKVTSLDAVLQSPVEEFSMYTVNLRACQYVDLLSGRHSVDAAELPAAAVDHLCPVLPGLIEGINQNDTRRLALVMFCAVYMQIRAEDAYIFGADRWGINLIAQIERKRSDDGGGGGGSPMPLSDSTVDREWKEFRFAFSQEVNNTEQFCIVLAEMEKECLEALKLAQEQLTGSTTQ